MLLFGLHLLFFWWMTGCCQIRYSKVERSRQNTSSRLLRRRRYDMLDFRPLAGLTGALLLVVILGVVATLGFSNTDLANFITNSAKARAQDQETKIASEKATIDLDLYRQIETEKAQAQHEQIQLDLTKQREQNRLDLLEMQELNKIELEQQRLRARQQLELERVTRYTILVVGGCTVMALSTALTYRFVRQNRTVSDTHASRIRYPNATNKPAMAIDRWHNDPTWKQSRVLGARMRELTSRQVSKAMRENPTAVSFKRRKEDEDRKLVDHNWPTTN